MSDVQFAQPHGGAVDSGHFLRTRLDQVVFGLTSCAVVISLIASVSAYEHEKVLFALAAVCAPAVVYLLIAAPRSVTYVVLFLVYANVPVVLIKFHGMPYAAAAAIPAALVWSICYYVFLKQETIVFPWALPWIVAYIGTLAVSALFCDDPAAACREVLVAVVEGATLFFLVINAVRSKEDLRASIRALLVAGAFMGVIACHQYISKSYHSDYGGFAQIEREGTFEFQSSTGKVVQQRAAGPIGQKNRFAQIMVLLLPLAACGCATEQTRLMRLFAAFALLLIGIGWALAFSRGSAVGLAITVGGAIWMGYVRFRHLAVLAFLIGLLFVVIPQYQSRMASLVGVLGLFEQDTTQVATPDGAIRGRATEMLAAVNVFADYPILGVGLGQSPRFIRQYGNDLGISRLKSDRKSHSLYPQVLAECGIVGAFFFFTLIGMTFVRLHAARSEILPSDPELASYATALFLMMLAYFATGVFAHISYVRYLWLMLALAHACIRICNINAVENSGRGFLNPE